MNLEGFGYQSESENVRRDRSELTPIEFRGGPLKPNDLVTRELGLNKAEPMLRELKVLFKSTLRTPEAILSDKAVSPVEYRIEILDSHDPDKAADEGYALIVFDTLRKAGVDVYRSASNAKEVKE